MMKGILGASLILNIILGFFLLTKKEPETQVVVEEKTIVKPVLVKQDATVAATIPEQTNKKKDEAPAFHDLTQFEQSEFQDAGEKMESDRHDFFTEKLGMNEDKITEHNRIREEFYRESAKFWQKDPTRELTFNERRQMIDMEEGFHAKLEKLHGKKNWEIYQKYRERYNSQGFKKQQEENQPFIFMGL